MGKMNRLITSFPFTVRISLIRNYTERVDGLNSAIYQKVGAAEKVWELPM